MKAERVAPWLEIEDGYPTEEAISELERAVKERTGRDSEDWHWWARFLVHDLPEVRALMCGGKSYASVEQITEWWKRSETEVSISTAGWSGAEEIMDLVWDADVVQMAFAYSWRRGGHYVFRIWPTFLEPPAEARPSPMEDGDG